MKKLYYINILIGNDLGELVDKQLVDETLQGLRTKLEEHTATMFNEAENYAEENNMVVEEIFDSKEEMELAMDNGLTSDDLNNN